MRKPASPRSEDNPPVHPANGDRGEAPDDHLPHGFLERGFTFLKEAGSNTTRLDHLMPRSVKDWFRFARAWADQRVPFSLPRPHKTHNLYHYTVPVPNPDDFSFVLVGDTGINSPGELLVTTALSRSDVFPSDFLVILGDVIYPAGSEADYRLGLLEAFRHYTKPILAIPGNHDWYDRLKSYERFFITGAIRNRALDHYQWRCPKLPNFFYYMDIGPKLRVICLDTGISGRLRENRRAQLAWLDAVLAHSEDKKLLVFTHHPLYSLANRRSEKRLRRLLEERFRQAGVAAVFSGHHHNYQRHEIDGMTQVIAGAGGATLHRLPERTVVSRPGRPSVTLEKPPDCDWDEFHSFLHCHWRNGELFCQTWSAHDLPPAPGCLMDSFTL